MKYLFLFIVFLIAPLAFGQTSIPAFLQGTWSVENKEFYEHWDKLNNQNLKGISYKLENEQMVVLEYLNISKNNNNIIYTATVIGQNQGKSIKFQGAENAGIYTFKNPNHTFPKEIMYQKLSETEIFVRVSDGKKEFSYKIIKQNK